MTFVKSVFSLKDLPANGYPELCISGRSNVGKSSMINRLSRQKKLAKISGKPGKTRSLNYFEIPGGFYFVDLPGYGYAKVPKTEKAFFSEIVGPYLETRQELRGIIQLIDSRHGPVSGDLDMIEWLSGWQGRVLYVYTKADKLSNNQRMTLKSQYDKKFGFKNSIMFSSQSGYGTEAVHSWIDDVLAPAKLS